MCLTPNDFLDGRTEGRSIISNNSENCHPEVDVTKSET